jgi:Fur family transcriptional regulator, stress-responsive regulator
MLSDPASLLKKHGLPVTAQRMAVLRVVAVRPHCTADEIAEDVRAGIGTISRQAVYDALKLLVDKGLLRRIQPAGSAALYEDRVGDNHHHIICRQCGQTADVNCAIGAAPCLNAANNAGYQIDEAEVIYWGTCPKCQKATRTMKLGRNVTGKRPTGGMASAGKLKRRATPARSAGKGR